MRGEWRPFLLTTITFLGERPVIFDPEAAILVAGHTVFEGPARAPDLQPRT
jgi:hypothetical protein